ncbi:MAG: signal recognition particle receptor subunit alpha, partial [Promethearchaeota archaeon]
MLGFPLSIRPWKANMMVLGKLGSSLHQAVQKLLRSSVVDEKSVKELVQDLQRALLQA